MSSNLWTPRKSILLTTEDKPYIEDGDEVEKNCKGAENQKSKPKFRVVVAIFIAFLARPFQSFSVFTCFYVFWYF